MSEDTCLYRHFDDAGKLLYVGISLNALKRLHEHREKHWFRRIARVEIEWFSTWEEALAAEAKAIIDENPECNIAGRDAPPAPPPPPEPEPPAPDQFAALEGLDTSTPNGKRVGQIYRRLLRDHSQKVERLNEGKKKNRRPTWAYLEEQEEYRKLAEVQVIAENLRQEALNSGKSSGAAFDRWRAAENMLRAA
jgi:hypothetical protein